MSNNSILIPKYLGSCYSQQTEEIKHLQFRNSKRFPKRHRLEMSVDIVIRDDQHIVMTKNTPTKESKRLKKEKLSAYNILFSLCYSQQ